MARANISLEAFYAARLVGHMVSLSFVYMYLYFFIHFLFGFKSGVWLSIPPNPVHCFSIRKRLLIDVCQ